MTTSGQKFRTKETKKLGYFSFQIRFSILSEQASSMPNSRHRTADPSVPTILRPGFKSRAQHPFLPNCVVEKQQGIFSTEIRKNVN